ncbi:hypothetical protein [Thermococcus chitonophagus]|nr:hypothetical protein [Thermococcus chitonophagus]
MIDVRVRTFTGTVKATMSLHFLTTGGGIPGKEPEVKIPCRKFLGGGIDG